MIWLYLAQSRVRCRAPSWSSGLVILGTVVMRGSVTTEVTVVTHVLVLGLGEQDWVPVAAFLCLLTLSPVFPARAFSCRLF